jgi:drug/metabolite transporter (DMT)-like permease
MIRPVPKVLAYVFLALACILWGSSFVIGKYAIQEMPALDISFWRSFFAFCVFGLILAKKRPSISGKEAANFLYVATLMIPVTYLLQFGALHYINAANAAVVIGIEPMTIALASWILLGSRLTPRIWTAALLGAIAVYVLFGSRVNAAGSLIGYGMVFASTIVVALWVVLTKKLLTRFTPLVSTSYISVLGFLPMLVLLPWIDLNVQKYSASIWMSVALLTVSSSILGNFLWNLGLKSVNSEKAGIFLALEPVAGVVLAVLFLNEPLTQAILLSLGLVVVAILIATSARSTRASKESSSPASLALDATPEPP